MTTIRLLKEHGEEVYFEEQNIYSLDSKGELLLTIMSSLAQEESRNISENVTWGMRKRFADGKVALPYKQFLGYKKGADGIPEIVPEEAATIKLIYRLFMEGKSPAYIARFLSSCNIPSPAGRPQWRPETVKSILSNEKYKGDAILQKTFCTDFLTKKMKVNEGEVPQYYVENSIPLSFRRKCSKPYRQSLPNVNAPIIGITRRIAFLDVSSATNAEHYMAARCGIPARNTRQRCGNAIINTSAIHIVLRRVCAMKALRTALSWRSTGC